MTAVRSPAATRLFFLVIDILSLALCLNHLGSEVYCNSCNHVTKLPRAKSAFLYAPFSMFCQSISIE